MVIRLSFRKDAEYTIYIVHQNDFFAPHPKGLITLI